MTGDQPRCGGCIDRECGTVISFRDTSGGDGQFGSCDLQQTFHISDVVVLCHIVVAAVQDHSGSHIDPVITGICCAAAECDITQFMTGEQRIAGNRCAGKGLCRSVVGGFRIIALDREDCLIDEERTCDVLRDLVVARHIRAVGVSDLHGIRHNGNGVAGIHIGIGIRCVKFHSGNNMSCKNIIHAVQQGRAAERMGVAVIGDTGGVAHDHDLSFGDGYRQIAAERIEIIAGGDGVTCGPGILNRLIAVLPFPAEIACGVIAHHISGAVFHRDHNVAHHGPVNDRRFDRDGVADQTDAAAVFDRVGCTVEIEKTAVCSAVLIDIHIHKFRAGDIGIGAGDGRCRVGKIQMIGRPGRICRRQRDICRAEDAGNGNIRQHRFVAAAAEGQIIVCSGKDVLIRTGVGHIAVCGGRRCDAESVFDDQSAEVGNGTGTETVIQGEGHIFRDFNARRSGSECAVKDKIFVNGQRIIEFKCGCSAGCKRICNRHRPVCRSVEYGFAERCYTVKGIEGILCGGDNCSGAFRIQRVGPGVVGEGGLNAAHCIPVGIFVLRCGEDFAPGQTVGGSIGRIEVISRCRCIRCVHPFAVAEVVEHAVKFPDQCTCISRCARGSNGNGTVHRNRRAENIFISQAGNGGGNRVQHTIGVAAIVIEPLIRGRIDRTAVNGIDDVDGAAVDRNNVSFGNIVETVCGVIDIVSGEYGVDDVCGGCATVRIDAGRTVCIAGNRGVHQIERTLCHHDGSAVFPHIGVCICSDGGVENFHSGSVVVDQERRSTGQRRTGVDISDITAVVVVDICVTDGHVAGGKTDGTGARPETVGGIDLHPVHRGLIFAAVDVNRTTDISVVTVMQHRIFQKQFPL